MNWRFFVPTFAIALVFFVSLLSCDDEKMRPMKSYCVNGKTVNAIYYVPRGACVTFYDRKNFFSDREILVLCGEVRIEGGPCK